MSKKLKKVLEAHLIAVEERLSDFEMRLFNAIEAVREQLQQLQLANATPERKSKKGKNAEAAAETTTEAVAEVKTEAAPAAEEKSGKKAKAGRPAKAPDAPKRPYNKKPKAENADTAAAKLPDYPADDLRNIKGIGPALADKIISYGVKNVYDLANIDEGTAEQIAENVPLFAARFVKQQWREQAQSIVANLQNAHNESTASAEEKDDE